MDGLSEDHMHTTVKPGEPDREHCCRPPTWLPIGQQKSRVLSAGGHRCTKMSCEKAIWSDLHHGVGGDNRGPPFYRPWLICFLESLQRPPWPVTCQQEGSGSQHCGLLTCPFLCSV